MENIREKGGADPEITPLSLIRKTHPFRWLGVIALFVARCQTYYKAVPTTPTGPEVAAMEADGQFLVLHHKGLAWHIFDISLAPGEDVIRGSARPLSEDHAFHERTKAKGKPTPYAKQEGDPLQEVHIYASAVLVDSAGNDPLPFQWLRFRQTDMDSVFVYDKAAGATIASYALGGTLITAGIIGVTALAVWLSPDKEATTDVEVGSCPFVYIYDAEGSRLVGELFGGAMLPCMERDDIIPLPGLEPVQEEYLIRLENQLQERQYTNLAELIVVYHDDFTDALVDQNGGVQILYKPSAPLRAVSDAQPDLRNVLAEKDDRLALFDDRPEPDKTLNNVMLTFRNPTGAKTGKLVLRAKSSLWLDYIFGLYAGQFGTAYATYVEEQRKLPGSVHYQWAQEQGLSLSVYLESGGRSTLVTSIPTTGPVAARDMVIPVDISDVSDDEVTIRLSCGFMCWELDYAAMDFSDNTAFKVKTLPAYMASDEEGRDVTALLRETDDKYLEQPKPGNKTVASYKAPPSMPGLKRSVFLHSRGYYEPIRAYTHEPNLGYTKTFTKPGAFSKFSKERYADLLEPYSVRTDQSDDAKR